MTTLRPFFMLAFRASVFWLGLLQLLVVGLVALELTQPDSELSLYIDTVFMAVFALPVAVGAIAGAAVQEFQHTTFATLLPGVRSRVVSGYLAAGIALTVVVVGLIALNSGSPQNLPVLFVVGVAAYCLGGVLIDPLNHWITGLNVVLVLFVIGTSRRVARVAGDHPWMAVVVALAVGAVCVYRLFARSTFRLKPFRPTSPLPGRFALERSQQVALKRLVEDRPRSTGWGSGYLGHDTWRWVRAAIHETYGPFGWKHWSRAIGHAWGLGALLLLSAWADKGEMSLGEALARSIFDALFRSPHELQFGEKGGPYGLLMVVLAIAGALTALFTPVALNDSLTHPLSRRQRARVHFRGGLVDVGIYLFVVGPFMFAVGHLAGWFVGYEPRFDFMPFFFRVLLVVVILMPLAHRGRLGLQAAMRRRAENTMVAVGFGILGFGIAVSVGTFISPRLFGSPAVELVGLSVALLLSQWAYRRTLSNYYQTSDLL